MRDYKKDYGVHELEPFFPNEIVRMSAAISFLLSVILFLVVVPPLAIPWMTGDGHEAQAEPEAKSEEAPPALKAEPLRAEQPESPHAKPRGKTGPVAAVGRILGNTLAFVNLYLEHPDKQANRYKTPEHIKPEWYFLAVYQLLKVMPSNFMGVEGALLGILLQNIAIVLLILLPFLDRTRPGAKSGPLFYFLCTACIAVFIAFTIWGKYS